jgi:DNA-binding CsgD family transcriptional regulator
VLLSGERWAAGGTCANMLAAATGQSFVVTTGTGSGKSLYFFIDHRPPRCAPVPRARHGGAGRAARCNARGCSRFAAVGPTEAADAVVVPSTAVTASPDGDVPLTPRELEVLALLAEGASNKVIARRLGISVHTAKFHVASLLDKLDAVGRIDAVTHAARRGVINL